MLSIVSRQPSKCGPLLRQGRSVGSRQGAGCPLQQNSHAHNRANDEFSSLYGNICKVLIQRHLDKQRFPNLKPVREIPGLAIFPIIGSWPGLAWRTEFSLRRMPRLYDQLFSRYGPIFRVRLPGGRNQVIVKDSENVKKVVTNAAIDREPRRVCYEALFRLWRKELVRVSKQFDLELKDGLEWDNLRPLVCQHLLEQEHLDLETKLIDEVTLEFCERMWLIRDPIRRQMPSDFMTELQRWGVEAMLYSLLGNRSDKLTSDLKPGSIKGDFMIGLNRVDFWTTETEYQPQFWRVIDTRAYWKLRSNVKLISDYLMPTLESQRLAMVSSPSDTTRTLMHKLGSDDRVSHLMDLHAALMYLLTAGSLAVPHHACKLMYCMSRYPETQDKLWEEINKVIGGPTAPITFQQLQEMPYLEAFIKETHRTMPTLGTLTRTVIEPLELWGYSIPEGWSVTLPLFLMAQDETEIKEPRRFIPERFMEGHSDLAPAPMTVLPYSFGSRQCPGQKVSEVLLKVFTIRLMQRYTVEHPFLMSKRSGIAQRLHGHMGFLLDQRNPSPELFSGAV